MANRRPRNSFTHRSTIGVRGWVYVISNKSIPGLVKVGYSTKDPTSRAEELNHTGIPHKYVVDYDVLVDDPFRIEKKAHKLLGSVHESKEWFRCSAENAVVAIKQCIDTPIYSENFGFVDREKISRQEAENLEKKLKEQSEIDIKNQIDSEISEIKVRCASLLKIRENSADFRLHWGIAAAVIFLVASILKDAYKFQINNFSLGLLSVAAAAYLAIYSKRIHLSRIRNMEVYKSLLTRRDELIADAQFIKLTCNSCNGKYLVDKSRYLNPYMPRLFKCSHCSNVVRLEAPKPK